MNVTIQLLIIAIVISILGGCTTYRWWRDNYMGRTILEPHLIYAQVERDSYGNPILPNSTAPRPSAKEARRHD